MSTRTCDADLDKLTNCTASHSLAVDLSLLIGANYRLLRHLWPSRWAEPRVYRLITTCYWLSSDVPEWLVCTELLPWVALCSRGQRYTLVCGKVIWKYLTLTLRCITPKRVQNVVSAVKFISCSSGVSTIIICYNTGNIYYGTQILYNTVIM